MRIAIAGKGGAGKTTIAAAMARLAAQRGTDVLAIDGDSNPNLAAALGIDADHVAAAQPLPASLISRRLDGPRLTIPIGEIARGYGIAGPDGVRLVLMGMPTHAEEGCLCSAHGVVSATLSDLGESPERLAVLDMEASPEHLSRGTARHTDVLLLVAEPYYRSLETVRRMASLAAELPIPRVAIIVNKVRSEAEAEAVGEFCELHGLERLGDVPWGDEVLEADGARVPLLDAAPESSTVAAAAHLVRRLDQAPDGVGSLGTAQEEAAS